MLPRVLWVALIGLVVLLADSIPRLMASDWEGLPVQQVRHQPEESQQEAIDPAVLGEMLPQKAGEPYSSQKIRESIERLFATGRFTDVRVDAVREDGGAVLTFLTKSAYFIGAVKFRGVAAPPTVRQLHSASHFELGHLFSEEAVSEAIEGLRRLLEEDGYFDARIAPSYETHPDTQQIDVTFDIHTGKRARFGEVVVTGSPVFPAARLLKQAKWKRGKSFTASLVQNGLGRIQKLYQQGDYLDASVEITQRRFRPEGNLADLELATATPAPCLRNSFVISILLRIS